MGAYVIRVLRETRPFATSLVEFFPGRRQYPENETSRSCFTDFGPLAPGSSLDLSSASGEVAGALPVS